MKLDKAERVLENFMEDKSCPSNVRQAIETLMDTSTHEFHRLNFARCYLNGMTSLSDEDTAVLREGIR